jgi:predicted phage terminase large subunit-like protein
MDRMKQWHAVWTRELGLDATWNENDKAMTFPSGARILFGHIAYENEKYNYLGAEYSACLWDELTQFNANTYKYLFSRLRRLKGSTVPIRMRAASNPGNVGHEWVRQRFVATNGMYPDRIFIPSKLEDNPYLTYEEYVVTLAELDPVTREQMLKGDWTARMAGGKFRREWFRLTADLPPGLILKWTPDGPVVYTKPEGLQLVRYWDLAATEPRPGEDPDWTVGALVAEKDGQYWIIDIRRFRKTPKGVEDEIRRTAERDGHHTAVYMEREPGASGKITIDHYARTVLKGYAFWGNPARRNKEVRANPVSSAAEAENVFLYDDGFSGTWVESFIDEAEAFPNVEHDDQVDAVSGAFEVLAHPDDDVYEDLVSVEEPW